MFCLTLTRDHGVCNLWSTVKANVFLRLRPPCVARKGGIGGYVRIGRREVVKRLGELSSCEINHDKVWRSRRSEEAGRSLRVPSSDLDPYRDPYSVRSTEYVV